MAPAKVDGAMALMPKPPGAANLPAAGAASEWPFSAALHDLSVGTAASMGAAGTVVASSGTTTASAAAAAAAVALGFGLAAHSALQHHGVH